MKLEAGMPGIGKLTLETPWEVDASFAASGLSADAAHEVLVDALGPSCTLFLQFALAACMNSGTDRPGYAAIMERVELQLRVAAEELRAQG